MNIVTPEIGLLIIGGHRSWSCIGTQRQGKKFKCPDCGEVFPAPMMDERIFGSGWTLPYVCQVACPKCGAKRSRKSYEKIKAEP